MMKNPINRLYNGKMDVIIYRKIKNVEGETSFEEQVLYKDKVCALSSIKSTLSQKLRMNETGGARLESITCKIFCDSDFFVPSGSKIKVMQMGRTQIFDYSGEAFVYPTHQELTVKKQSEV